MFFPCMQLSVQTGSSRAVEALHGNTVPSFSSEQKCDWTVLWPVVFQTPLPILRSKADVSLALKLQSHSWQPHNVRGPKLLSGRGMMPGRAMCFSIKNRYVARPSNFYPPSKHFTPSPDLRCSVSPLAVLSAVKSPFLSYAPGPC